MADNIIVWVLALGVVGLGVGALQQANPAAAWMLVVLVLLSALVLDGQAALNGLNAAFAAARG